MKRRRAGSGAPKRMSRVAHDYTAVIERCSRTRLFVGWIPGFAGAHSQGATLVELMSNLHEVVGMLLEDGAPVLEAEYVGTRSLRVVR
jgi:predicted RNase H-like HicB family nuclease